MVIPKDNQIDNIFFPFAQLLLDVKNLDWTIWGLHELKSLVIC